VVLRGHPEHCPDGIGVADARAKLKAGTGTQADLNQAALDLSYSVAWTVAESARSVAGRWGGGASLGLLTVPAFAIGGILAAASAIHSLVLAHKQAQDATNAQGDQFIRLQDAGAGYGDILDKLEFFATTPTGIKSATPQATRASSTIRTPSGPFRADAADARNFDVRLDNKLHVDYNLAARSKAPGALRCECRSSNPSVPDRDVEVGARILAIRIGYCQVGACRHPGGYRRRQCRPALAPCKRRRAHCTRAAVVPSDDGPISRSIGHNSIRRAPAAMLLLSPSVRPWPSETGMRRSCDDITDVGVAFAALGEHSKRAAFG